MNAFADHRRRMQKRAVYLEENRVQICVGFSSEREDDSGSATMVLVDPDKQREHLNDAVDWCRARIGLGQVEGSLHSKVWISYCKTKTTLHKVCWYSCLHSYSGKPSECRYSL